MKNNHTLQYKLKEGNKKDYKVQTETLYKNPIVEAKYKTEYKIEFSYLKEGSFNSLIIKNRKYDLKNLSEKETEIEKIMMEINNFFPEIDYRISKKGEIINIENLNKLKSVWYEKRSELRKKYLEKYEEIEYLINGIQESLNNPNLVNNYFKNYGINNIFFGELYGDLYIEDGIKNKKISIPEFIIYYPLPLKLNIYTKEINVKNDEMLLEINAVIDETKLNRTEIEEMIKANLPDEQIKGLIFELKYLQNISFYLSTGLVRNSDLLTNIKIFNKNDKKELFQNEIKLLLKEEKYE